MADYRARYPRYFCCGKGVKQMVSAAFGFNQRTGLLPLEGDPESARGGVTSWAIYRLWGFGTPSIYCTEPIKEIECGSD